MNSPDYYMRRALELAALALANVRSNPMVGAVVVKNGVIIAEGYHEKFGESHAEINALKKLSPEESHGAELYVTLEPCCHYGKTPPCTQAVIAAGIKKVFYGMEDPNPEVAGKGLEALRNASMEVEGPILESECRFLNRRFITLHEKKRPWVILKWAESQDGFIAPLPLARMQLSCPESAQLVQRYRSEEMAIMVGTTTCLVDNPRLTSGLPNVNQPLRVTIDRHGRLSPSLAIFQDFPTILFSGAERTNQFSPNVTILPLKNWPNPILEILEYLGSIKITSLIVEGGAELLRSIIQQHLWDESRIFQTQRQLNTGIPSPLISREAIRKERVGVDVLNTAMRS